MVAQQTSAGAGVGAPQSQASFPIPQLQRYPNSSKIFLWLTFLFVTVAPAGNSMGKSRFLTVGLSG